MNFDELTHAWQSQDPDKTVAMDVTVLKKLVHREQQNWRLLLLCRDIREMVACCLVVSFTLYAAIAWGFTLAYPLAGAALFIGGFFLVDRALQRSRQPRKEQPLVEFLTRSIDQMDHQIWLLRNVLWWYLLPGIIATAVILGYVFYLVVRDGVSSQADVWALLFLCGVAAGSVWIDMAVYRLNQRAVRDELEPRKQELAELLAMCVHADQDDAT